MKIYVTMLSLKASSHLPRAPKFSGVSASSDTPEPRLERRPSNPTAQNFTTSTCAEHDTIATLNSNCLALGSIHMSHRNAQHERRPCLTHTLFYPHTGIQAIVPSPLSASMAANTVLTSYKLVEQILMELPLRQLLLSQNVSKTFYDMIQRSSDIRKALFLTSTSETAYPTRVSRSTQHSILPAT